MALLNNNTKVKMLPYIFSTSLFITPPAFASLDISSYIPLGMDFMTLPGVDSLSYQIVDIKKPFFSRKPEKEVKKYDTITPVALGPKVEPKELPKSVLETISYEIIAISNRNLQKAELKGELKVANSIYDEEKKSLTYVVLQGDTLNIIGKKLGLNWQDIAKKNKIFAKNDYRIYAGQELNVNLDENLEGKIAREQFEAKTLAKAEVKSENNSNQLESKLKSRVVNFQLLNEKLQALNSTSTSTLNSIPNSSLNLSSNCHEVEVKLLKSKHVKYIAKETNLHPDEVMAQTKMKSTRFNPGVYTLCVKKDEKTGYIPLHHNHNWELIKTKSGGEIWSERRKFGVFGLGKILGVKPGNCFSNLKDKDTILAENKEIFDEAQKQFNVDANVLASISKIESGGNSKCLSPTGALGSMGLTRYYYNDSNLEPINPFNKKEAVFRAAEKLAELLKKYNSSYHLALSAYNQGEDRVDVALEFAKARGVNNSFEIVNKFLPTKEGKNYSKIVLAEAKMIKHS